MFQVLDSPGKSDTDEYEVREEEYVGVEDMSHRNNQRATEVRGENWQKAMKKVTHSVVNDEKRAKEEPEQSPKKKQRDGELPGQGSTWPCPRTVQSSDPNGGGSVSRSSQAETSQNGTRGARWSDEEMR